MEVDFKERVVPHSAKIFAQRLNRCLDDMDAPAAVRERAAILGKLLDIPRHQAWGLIEGHQFPDAVLLNQIAQEFEVDPKWLSGDK